MTIRKRTLAATGGIAALLATSALSETPVHVLESHTTLDGKYRVELADYRVHQPGNQVYELFSILLPGGTPKKIGKPTSISEDVVPGFVVSGDSKRAVYSQRNTALGTDRQLYSASLDGITWLKISQPMVPTGGVLENSIKLTSDGMSVKYVANPSGILYFNYMVGVYGGHVWTDVFHDSFESGGFAAWSGVVR